VATVVEVPGGALHYRLDGPEAAPVLVLSNSLGTSLAMWEPQLPALTRGLRVLRYDSRGHGGSPVAAHSYDLAQLGADVVGLLDALAIPRAHFCGLSMGGMVGMWLGVHAASRVDRLVLCNTAPCIGTAELWNTRIARVRAEGLGAIADSVLERWYTPAFRERAPDALARTRALLLATPDEGYAMACAAIRDADLWPEIAAIRAPTLVIAGAHDPATTAADGRRLAQRIPGARYVELDAAHLSNVEAEAAFTGALTDFLAD
jgi:3-oxoadipate enol-lactonase